MRFAFCLLLAAAGFASEIMAIETSRAMVDLTIVTNDAARAREFYGLILGLPEIAASRFKVGAGAIEIVAPAKPAATYQEEMHLAVGIRGIALYLSDADGIIERLAKHGRPALNFVGAKGNVRVGRTKDPDGNWVELVLMPGAPAEKLNQMAIILMVGDEARSREFYGKTLGLADAQPHGKPETGLLYAYTAGGSTILVRGIGDKPNHAGAPEETVGYRAMTFPVHEPAAVERMLRARGVKIVASAPMLTAVDPDGNYLRFVGE